MRISPWLVVALFGASAFACSKDKAAEKSEKSESAVVKKEAAPKPAGVSVPSGLLALYGALPASFETSDVQLSDEAIALGRQLYFEARVSKDGTVSCNSCHGLDNYGVDGKVVSEGVGAQKGERNAPTVFNAAGHFVQFWDGRAANVEEQAKGPVLNPIEHGLKDAKEVEKILAGIDGYEALFKAAFPGAEPAISFDHFASAIGAFERTLVTPGRWDKFIAGDASALSDAEKTGFLKFNEVGCNACHSGPQLGGTMYQKLGLAKPWPSEKDLGRFAVTKQESDKMMFKVPGLRNVEKTAPYYHDGSVATLDEAIKSMADHQLNKTLSDADIASISTFLKALTAEIPAEMQKAPELPGLAKAE